MSDDVIHDVPLKDIEVGDVNVRHHDVDRDLDDLARSIKRHGLLQPIVLLGKFGSPKYKIIVGQRRYLAHKQLKSLTIRAVFAGPITKKEAALQSLAENMHRVELNHADAAAAVTALYVEYGRDDRRVATETGMSLKRVRQYISVEARATPKMKELLKNRRVTIADLQRSLRAAQEDPAKAEKLLMFMVKNDLTTHQKRRVAEYGEGHPTAGPEEILEEAQRPRVEQRLMVTLPERVRSGLDRAVKKLAMEADEVATKALSEWLEAQGFITP